MSSTPPPRDPHEPSDRPGDDSPWRDDRPGDRESAGGAYGTPPGQGETPGQGAYGDPGRPGPGAYGQPEQSGQPAYGQPGHPGPAAYGPPGGQRGPDEYHHPRNGMGTAALVVGIVSLLLAWLPIIGLIGLLGGIVAIILGIVGLARVRRRVATNKGSSIAGIVLGAAAVILAGVITALSFTLVSQYWNEDVRECVQQYGNDQAGLEQCIRENVEG